MQDAEDVFGEATVALWDNFRYFKKGTNFSAWARRIAHLRVLEYYRARDRRLVFPQPLLDQLAVDFESRDKAADQRLLYLSECKEELSPEDRQLLEERYVDNLRVQDLARRLAQSENSVSKSLGRIRRVLLACVERRMAAEKRAGS